MTMCRMRGMMAGEACRKRRCVSRVVKEVEREVGEAVQRMG